MKQIFGFSIEEYLICLKVFFLSFFFKHYIMDDGLLIEQVEKFKHLYDKRSNLFKNKLARENAWKSIGHILETEGIR